MLHVSAEFAWLALLCVVGFIDLVVCLVIMIVGYFGWVFGLD